MQNKYVGDVGDFGKYGMLRFLVSTCNNLKIGVNWYLVDDEDTTDGKHTSYLNKNKDLCNCDLELYYYLKSLIEQKKRNIMHIENDDIIPGCIYFSDLLKYETNKITENQIMRELWFSRSLDKLQTANVIYVDPDNGLEVKSQNIHSSKGIKYVSYKEIYQYYKNGKSIIVYNHRDRKPEDIYKQRFTRIKNDLQLENDLIILRFVRYSVRDYIFILQKEHYHEINRFVNLLMSSHWSSHFKLIGNE
ncbi:hypothetical protein [Candidatus Methanomassiliicoccus intestinalis]|uniref:hypothetical protein n=1 Tax=Candidatus Methanomassiliicoccus intestinalis TaxID=1406512 RepID=UPI0037DD0FBC